MSGAFPAHAKRETKSIPPLRRRPYDLDPTVGDAMGRLDFIGDLDRSKIVALDFATAEFRQQAHRLVADWATRSPFYVLGKGPPQVIVGRYADVLEVFSDTERFASELPKGPGYEQYDKFMGLTFLTQTRSE